MKFKHKYVEIVTMSIVSLGLLSYSMSSSAQDTKPQFTYKIKASQARLNRLVTGPVVATVNGVPAEPVDSFVWDGKGSVPIKGEARLSIDPVSNTGEIYAEWEDVNGSWTYQQKSFVAPRHPGGLRIGSSVKTTELVKNDAVTTNVYLHGDTKAAPPVLPTVFALLATWGPAKITHNGMAFSNPYLGPVPNWLGHSMTSVGVRNADGTVRTKNGKIYNFKQGSNGAVDRNDLEFHLIFHDMPTKKRTANFPARIAFLYHLTFEKVKIEIKQK